MSTVNNKIQNISIIDRCIKPVPVSSNNTSPRVCSPSLSKETILQQCSQLPKNDIHSSNRDGNEASILLMIAYASGVDITANVYRLVSETCKTYNDIRDQDEHCQVDSTVDEACRNEHGYVQKEEHIEWERMTYTSNDDSPSNVNNNDNSVMDDNYPNRRNVIDTKVYDDVLDEFSDDDMTSDLSHFEAVSLNDDHSVIHEDIKQTDDDSNVSDNNYANDFDIINPMRTLSSRNNNSYFTNCKSIIFGYTTSCNVSLFVVFQTDRVIELIGNIFMQLRTPDDQLYIRYESSSKKISKNVSLKRKRRLK